MDELKNKLIAEYIERNNIKLDENQDIEDVLNIEDKYDGYNLKELSINDEKISIEYDEYDNVIKRTRNGKNYKEVLKYDFDGKLNSSYYSEKTKNDFDEEMLNKTVIKYHRNGCISSKTNAKFTDNNTYNYYKSEGFTNKGEPLFSVEEETKHNPIHEDGKEYSTKVSKSFYNEDGKAMSKKYFLEKYPEYADEINALDEMKNVDYKIKEEVDVNGNLARQIIQYGDYTEEKEYKNGKLASKSLDKNTEQEILHKKQIYNKKGELEIKSYVNYDKVKKTGESRISNGHGDTIMAIHVDKDKKAKLMCYSINSINPNEPISSNKFYQECVENEGNNESLKKVLNERDVIYNYTITSGFDIEDVSSNKNKLVNSILGKIKLSREMKEYKKYQEYYRELHEEQSKKMNNDKDKLKIGENKREEKDKKAKEKEEIGR